MTAVFDNNGSADMAVLVDNGPFDPGSFTDCQRDVVAAFRHLHDFVLIIIGTHQDRISNRDIRSDHAPQSRDTVFDNGAVADTAGAMDLLEGKTIQAWVAERPVPILFNFTDAADRYAEL